MADVVTDLVTLMGNFTGMAIKYGTIMALPGIMGALFTAPITLAVAGLGMMGTIGSALIFVLLPLIIAGTLVI